MTEFSGVTPHLIVDGAAAAIEFYRAAFGADELGRQAGPDGRIWYAELLLNGGRILLVDEFPDMDARSPKALGGTPVMLHLYVEDTDAQYARAVEAGAEPLMPPADAFWGDRYAQVLDPFGHRWSIGTKVADLSTEETRDAASTWFAEHGNPASPPEATPT
jgi:uncharacterized glyoxalase superfamily protein PhnB